MRRTIHCVDPREDIKICVDIWRHHWEEVEWLLDCDKPDFERAAIERTKADIEMVYVVFYLARWMRQKRRK